VWVNENWASEIAWMTADRMVRGQPLGRGTRTLLRMESRQEIVGVDAPEEG
jgi:hypothetical protein